MGVKKAIYKSHTNAGLATLSESMKAMYGPVAKLAQTFREPLSCRRRVLRTTAEDEWN